MDLNKTIAELRARKDQLERIIAQLEELRSSDSAPAARSQKRRGRKFMGPEEREEVSRRMKTYWANRSKRFSDRAAT